MYAQSTNQKEKNMLCENLNIKFIQVLISGCLGVITTSKIEENDASIVK